MCTYARASLQPADYVPTVPDLACCARQRMLCACHRKRDIITKVLHAPRNHLYCITSSKPTRRTPVTRGAGLMLHQHFFFFCQNHGFLFCFVFTRLQRVGTGDAAPTRHQMLVRSLAVPHFTFTCYLRLGGTQMLNAK